MVGWSRRNKESAERRARWWASLTEEEREMETFVHEVQMPRETFQVLFWGLVVLVVAESAVMIAAWIAGAR